MQALLMRKLNQGKDIFNELRHKSMKDFFLVVSDIYYYLSIKEQVFLIQMLKCTEEV